jgi:hypothetical protein
MNNCCICWFIMHILKLHGSKSKILVKNLVRQHYAEGFNSGVKWVKIAFKMLRYKVCASRINNSMSIYTLLMYLSHQQRYTVLLTSQQGNPVAHVNS